MEPLQAWKTIISKLDQTPKEFHTVPIIKKVPLWFSATTDGESVFINNAIINRPSSNLKVPRRLYYRTFAKVYPLYLKRENGEQVSKEASRITVDKVYYFSLIRFLA
jgi:hypothetical protein